jgi:Fe(3+) dicitrate transport protein
MGGLPRERRVGEWVSAGGTGGGTEWVPRGVRGAGSWLPKSGRDPGEAELRKRGRGRLWGVLGLSAAFVLGAAGEAVAQGGAGSSGDVGGGAGEGTIRGVVTAEEGGAPLGGVKVEVVELGRAVYTDQAGRFVLERVPEGEWTLRFSYLGKGMLERAVRGGQRGTNVGRVTLETEAIRMEPLVVLQGRTRLVGEVASEAPGSAQVLGRVEMEGSRLPFDDVSRLLRQLPGVNVQEEEGFGRRPHIGLRGTGTERSSKVTLMEDGVLIAPAPYAAPAAYYFPTVGRMEAMEVRKGSSQVKYGPRTIGGALNLVSTPIPDGRMVKAELAGGGSGTSKLRARAGDSHRNVAWMLETYQLRSEGFKRLPTGGDTGFDLADYLAKLRINSDRGGPGAYQELELKLGYTKDDARETYLGLTEEDFRLQPLLRYAASQEDHLGTEHRQAQLRYFLRPGERVDFIATAYRNEFNRNWYKLGHVLGRDIGSVVSNPGSHQQELAVLRGSDSEPDALRLRANQREYLSQGIQAALGFRFGMAGMEHEMEAGLRFHQDQEDRFQHEDLYRMSGGRMTLTTAGQPGSQANQVADAEAWAFYLQDRLEVGILTLTPGVRHERIRFVRREFQRGAPERGEPVAVREKEVSAWIPGMGATLLLRPGVRLLAGVHRGFGPPGPGAAEETRPETSVNYEVGGRLFLAGVGVQATGFFSDYSNILGAATLSTGTNGSGDLYNGGAVQVKGLELAADYAPFLASSGLRLPVRLAYTYTEALFRSAFASAYAPWGTVEVGDELPYLPMHQVYVASGVGRGSWAIRLDGTYTSATRTRAGQGPIPEGERVDAALVLGMAGEVELPTSAALFFGVQNLTDARHVVARQPAGARPGLPRTLQVGIRVGL